MNIQSYIDSGIIESYILGLATPEEAAEFERLCRLYPELQKAKEDFEIELEKKAFQNAVDPPTAIREEVFNKLSASNPRHQAPSGMRWAIAASVALLICCGIFVYLMYLKNQELNREMSASRQKLEKLDRDLALLKETENIIPVKLITPDESVRAAVNVFWDSTNANVYLVIKDLKQLPVGYKYQVWAMFKDIKKSLGLFDAPANDDRLILKLDSVKQADSFKITIDKY